MIECRDLEGRMVWQQELWHTNDMGGGTGLAHKHYYLSFSMNSKGDQVYLFGISSNYAYIRGYNVADGTSIGFVYLDHSGVIK